MSQEVDELIKVGELLIRAGLITAEVLEDNVNLAARMHAPLSVVLETHGVLKPGTFNAAHRVQDQIDAKSLTLERGVKLLELVGRQGLDYDTAYRKVTQGLERKGEQVTHFLGELLRQAGLITSKQLSDGVAQSLNTGLPLGMVLIGMQAVTLHLLNSALMAEKLIRQKTVTREQAVQALRVARLRSITLTESLAEYDFAHLDKQFGVGELFVLAGLMTEAQLMSAREMELSREESLEQVFLDFGYASQICVSAAEQLLGIMADGSLSPLAAAEILKRLKDSTTTDEMVQVLSTIGSTIQPARETVSVNELLHAAAFVSEEEFATGSALSQQTKMPLTKILFDAGFITANALDAVNQCKAYMDQGLMDMQQAVITVVYCQENDCPFAETVLLFGWIPTLKE